jgi:hypothetical protein
MGTNQEQGKASAKAPAAEGAGQDCAEPPERAGAGCEPPVEMIRVVDSTEEVAGTGEELARLDPQIRAHLGQLVRATYATLVDEPVPERFLKLLEELEQAEQRH